MSGLPHSDIRGSTGARPSPRLFAACHVLHRLSVPRHPPNALLTQTLAISALRPTQARHTPATHPDDPASQSRLPGPITDKARPSSSTDERAERRRRQTSLSSPRSRLHQPLHHVQKHKTGTSRRRTATRTSSRSPAARQPAALNTVLPSPSSRTLEPGPLEPGPPWNLVEPAGLEPATLCLQSRCSPS